jgi:PAS domain S-box-containing protein
MQLRDVPIKRKLMRVILLTSGAVLLLTCTAFFAYEFVTFRQGTVRELSTLGKIIAANSTAALAFDSPEDADEILRALSAEKHIVAAALYDLKGNLFSHYPAAASMANFPAAPENDGYQFGSADLVSFQPVIQGNKRLGTLYLKSDMGAMYERFTLYGAIVFLVVILSIVLAYLLSKKLQQGISQPILALADTARAISDRKDYSVRATKWGEDEMGLLTDAFNHMLSQIEEQNHALSESEARVRAVLNCAVSAVIVIDEKGTIIDWNERAEKMFGWTREKAIGQELATTIIPPHFREAHRKGLRHFFVTGQGPVLNQLIELSAVRSNGEEFPIELSISPMRTKSTVTFCGFVTDITQRKQTEEEIRLFNQRLEQIVAERTNDLKLANKELAAFSYSISHDLRAPLRSIHGYMNIFSEEYSDQFDDEAKKLTAIVLNNAVKMGQLIDGLLAFSHLGRKELEKGGISMKEMVTGIWEELKKMEQGRDLECRILSLPDALGDRVTIRQVWTNLISNAIKYTRRKPKGTIEIGASTAEDSIIYYVKDNGAGFNMQYYDKLFGVFQRLHSQQEFEGTGVGLAIVQRIIAKHGGKIWAEAKQNEGATFYFSLATNHQEGD